MDNTSSATSASPEQAAERHGSLHTGIADTLRQRITRGELVPGTRLNERILCAELNVSRTPLREAFKLLAGEGLVELLANRGAVVTQLTLSDVTQMFEVLSVLEGLSGELACVRASAAGIARVRDLHTRMRSRYQQGDLEAYFELNQAIHRTILELAGNGYLSSVYDNLNTRLRRARYSANLSKERWDKAMREHEDILQALEARDGRRLRSILEIHLRGKCDVLIAALLARGLVSTFAGGPASASVKARMRPTDKSPLRGKLC
jgi:DNA-binding GntR family transcriptional regulator